MKYLFISIFTFLAVLNIRGEMLFDNGSNPSYASSIPFSGSWAAMGGFTNDYVHVVTIDGINVYAGGRFITIGGETANKIAKWNGSAWSPLGAGLNSGVSAILIHDGKVFVGGSFTGSGGTTLNHVAMWDGSWHPLGTGLTNAVNCLAFSGDTLYAGGNFTSPGNGRGNHISRWDGTSWKPLIDVTTGRDGLDNDVHAIKFFEGKLYAGGVFTHAGLMLANYIAVWDGSHWSPIISNGVNGVNNYVRAIESLGSDIYFGGEFTQAGDVPAKYIASWNGAEWSKLGVGIAGDFKVVMTLSESQGYLFVGGFFIEAGGVTVNNIAITDGTNWYPMLNGLGYGDLEHVYTVKISGNNVYAGGTFLAHGGQSPGGRISKWTFDFPFPVEMTSFTSNVINANVFLHWTVSKEINNSGFIIERSNIKDQSPDEWKNVGFVEGNGNSNIQRDYNFEDRNLSTGKYKYRLKQMDYNGNFEYHYLSNEVSIGTPDKFSLSQNYPNPFNPVTNLEFGISDLGFVSLKIYDITGKEIATLVQGIKNPGYYNVTFDAGSFSSGIYFYSLEVEGNVIDTKRMMLLK